MAQTRYLLYLLFIVALAFLVRSAWIGDDTFITLRTVDNWINGYGLTWNTAERVQTYTHPLWMFMLSGVYLFIRDGYFAALLLCILVSIAVFLLFLHYFSDNSFALVFGMLALLFSKSFVDFSTSGLENPASHLIFLIIIILIFRRGDPASTRTFLLLNFLSALALLNRLDFALILLPQLLYLFLTFHRSWKGIGLILLGHLPLIVWTLFSIIYYGFPLPNTFYAKLALGTSNWLLIRQGLMYFLNSLSWDPITLVVIAFSILLAFRNPSWTIRSIATGVVLYLAYIVFIGGDYMSGRFFSVVYLISLFLLLNEMAGLRPSYQFAIASVVLLLGFLPPNPPVSYFKPLLTSGIISDSDYHAANDDFSGISDERYFYETRTGMPALTRNLAMPNLSWAEEGRQLKRDGVKLYVRGVVGMVGYYAGPGVYILDPYAIGDPLLARIPVRKDDWRIGHFRRPLVEGYQETLESGANQIKDPGLAEYYEDLLVIIRGPVWSAERFGLIWKMNMGQLDYLLQPATDCGVCGP